MGVLVKLDKILKQNITICDIIEVGGRGVAECLREVTEKLSDIKRRIFDTNGILQVSVLLNGKVIYERCS